MDMSLSKLWKTVKDREPWRVTVHGVTKSWTQLSDWTTIANAFLVLPFISCALVILFSSLFLENSLITPWGFAVAVSSVWPVCASPNTFMIYFFMTFSFCTSWERLSLVVLNNILFYSYLSLLTWPAITLRGIAHLFTNPLIGGQEHSWVRDMRQGNFFLLCNSQSSTVRYIYICHIRATK